MDNQYPLLEAEQFDLLSAYLDGDVSPLEQQQVEAWLAEDPKVRQIYQQMQSIQLNLQSMPEVMPAVSPDVIVDQVMSRLDRRERRWRWSGIGAAAAVLLGALSSVLVGSPGGILQTASQPDSEQPKALSSPVNEQSSSVAAVSAPSENDPSMLMLALDRPPVDIPVVPIASDSIVP